MPSSKLLGVSLIVLALTAVGCQNTPSNFPFDFELKDINEEQHALSDYRGKVVIVDIWGTWCPPCIAEIPHFIELQEKYSDQGLQILGINYENAKSWEEQQQIISKFVEKKGINYPCMPGTDAVQNQIPGFNGFPTTLFIDKSGNVREVIVGLHSFDELEAKVKKLLAES